MAVGLEAIRNISIDWDKFNAAAQTEAGKKSLDEAKALTEANRQAQLQKRKEESFIAQNADFVKQVAQQNPQSSVLQQAVLAADKINNLDLITFPLRCIE